MLSVWNEEGGKDERQGQRGPDSGQEPWDQETCEFPGWMSAPDHLHLRGESPNSHGTNGYSGPLRGGAGQARSRFSLD